MEEFKPLLFEESELENRDVSKLTECFAVSALSGFRRKNKMMIFFSIEQLEYQALS